MVGWAGKVVIKSHVDTNEPYPKFLKMCFKYGDERQILQLGRGMHHKSCFISVYLNAVHISDQTG